MKKSEPESPYASKPLLDRLGVKPGHKVAVIGVEDDEFWALLCERIGRRPSARVMKDCDVVFYAADSVEALDRLEQLHASIVANGSIWVVSRKGKQATLKDTDVIAASKRAGLVDNKVVAFSSTHTALRLVIPLAQRASIGR